MKHRNPLLAGLFNILVPGSIHLYLRNDWRKSALMFVFYSLSLFVLVLLGNNIQELEVYQLAPGLCTGTLLLIAAVYLFYKGMSEANARNGEIASAAHYQEMRKHVSNGPK